MPCGVTLKTLVRWLESYDLRWHGQVHSRKTCEVHWKVNEVAFSPNLSHPKQHDALSGSLPFW